MSYFVVKVIKEYEQYLFGDFLSCFYLSNDKIKYLFSNQCCFINGQVASINDKISESDIICIDTSYFDHNNIMPEESNLNILYEDEYLLIVNKYSKCIIYPDDIKKNNTMANYVSYYYLKNDLFYKVRHVHRLDFDTTGCLVYAKDIVTHAALSKMIENGTFIRKYIAIVEGVFSNKKGKIDLSIGKDRHINSKMIVAKNGKNALTNYEVLESKNNLSLIELKLATGRTHQIRIHMSYLKHPLLGDRLYGSKIEADRVLLHSSEVEFIHPITKQHVCVKCPMPMDMKKVWKNKKVDFK